ncbi:MAG: MarR family transcriptional regulator [bacterium]|nr:MarR family transcriptional regulator [bacterium]
MKDENIIQTKIPEKRHDLKILQSLRRIIRAVDIHSRKLSHDYKITGPQLITLLTIAEKGPLPLASIAKEIHLSPSTLVGIVDRLEEKGYVSRERSTRDRRQVNISSTEEGMDFVKKSPSPLQETLAEALNKLSINEQETISQSLQRIVELMEAKGLDASPILQTGKINYVPKP